MAGHRRDDQQPWLRMAQRSFVLPFKMQKPAERLFPDRGDLDRGAHTQHFGFVQAPFGLAVAARGALEHLAGRRDRFAELGVGPGIERILEHDLGGIAQHSRRIERRVRHLIEPVHRRGQRRADLRRHFRWPTEFTNHVRHGAPRMLSFAIGRTPLLAARQQTADFTGNRWRNVKRVAYPSAAIHRPAAANRCGARCSAAR